MCFLCSQPSNGFWAQTEKEAGSLLCPGKPYHLPYYLPALFSLCSPSSAPATLALEQPTCCSPRPFALADLSLQCSSFHAHRLASSLFEASFKCYHLSEAAAGRKLQPHPPPLHLSAFPHFLQYFLHNTCQLVAYCVIDLFTCLLSIPSQ